MLLIERTEQLRALTGNYYANNDFTKVEGDIEQATEELARLVGEGVISLAEKADDSNPLRRLVQRPIAILATLRMYQKNDLSHEDDGRKFKVSTDGGDKLPWEWQLNRDDALQMEAYYRAVDSLITHLNKTKPEEWTSTSLYRATRQLIVRSGAQFDMYFPINRSERTYLLLVPFIREAQLMTVADAYGADWQKLVEEEGDTESASHYAAAMATCLLAMATALCRLPLKLLPCGVVRGYLAESGMLDSEPASLDDVRRASDWMRADAARWIDKMKRARDGSEPDYELLPRNHPRNKYCRL
mgnify:CR=1 FL=1|jgi:hypothetical protein